MITSYSGARVGGICAPLGPGSQEFTIPPTGEGRTGVYPVLPSPCPGEVSRRLRRGSRRGKRTSPALGVSGGGVQPSCLRAPCVVEVRGRWGGGVYNCLW